MDIDLKEVLNLDHFYNNIDKELVIVDVWFCRDLDGTVFSCNTKDNWKEPELNNRAWDIPMIYDFLTDGTNMSALAYGKGFFGVEKGEKKRMKLIAVKEHLE